VTKMKIKVNFVCKVFKLMFVYTLHKIQDRKKTKMKNDSCRDKLSESVLDEWMCSSFDTVSLILSRACKIECYTSTHIFVAYS